MAKKKKSKTKQPASPSSTNKQSTSTGAATDHSGITVDVFNLLWEDYVNKEDGDSSKKLVGAIDQGTSSTRFLVFTSAGRIAASAQMEHEQLFPKSGWHEHDPAVLWQNTVACIVAVCKNIKDSCDVELSVDTLAAIGITNQRETTIAWNKLTGKPYYNAIVWDDARTADIAQDIANDATAKQITAITGLPLSSYFAGTKVKWLLDNVETLRQDVAENPESVCFGTVDSWLLYNLTGHIPKSENTGRKLKGSAVHNIGGCFKTDVTNASRWLFMDLKSCTWDQDCINAVCAPHSLPVTVLPEICPSSHDKFGEIADGCGLPAALTSVPLTAVLGDQQSALFGQAAFTAGEAKNTYGTGLFLMMNTGTTAVQSTHGLLTTVAYQIGNDGPVHYALEGSVSHSGSTIQWLRDQLNIIDTAADSEVLARTVVSTEDLYFVPAFCGLFAPHWRADARGCIVGMAASHHKGHICRAALEAAAYQTKEVFDAIIKDTTADAAAAAGLKSLKVDGGGTHNKLLMQFQADIINIPVVKPKVMETTAMGAALAAGLAVGVWKDLDEIKGLWAVAETYEPKMSETERASKVAGWNKAVSKSLGWVGGDGHDNGQKLTEVSEDVVEVLASGTAEAEEAPESSDPPPVVEQQPWPTTREEPKVVDEEKKLPDSTMELNLESKPLRKDTDDDNDSEVAHVGDVHDVNVVSRENMTMKETANGFSTATLALTAGAALGIGVLLGSSTRKHS